MVETNYYTKAITFACNAPGCTAKATFDGKEISFQEAVKDLKEDGWSIKKSEKRYEHYCQEHDELSHNYKKD